MEILVPDLGDFSDVEVIEVSAKEGDTLALEDTIVVLETEKASMEIPLPVAGVVKSVIVNVGDRVSTGDVIANVEPDTAEVAATPAEEIAASAEPETSVTQGATPAPTEPETVVVPDMGEFSDVEIVEVLVQPGAELVAEQGLITLETEKAMMEVPAPRAGQLIELLVNVGDRVSTGDGVALVLPAANSEPEEKSPAEAKPVTVLAVPNPAPRPAPPQAASSAVNEPGFAAAHASPSVRKLARELGVDLAQVAGTGHKGRVTDSDLKAFVKHALREGGGSPLPAVASVDHAVFGAIEVEPLSRIQKISGPRLHASWVNVPHVTQHDEADITSLESKRQELKQSAAVQGIRLTPLAFIVRACILALEEYPKFATSLSDDRESLVVKKYRHIGFAADTLNGLVVPVIRDADNKNVFEIASDLAELSERARAGKLKREEMQGGVFTISSLGGIGGTAFTPIINAPEVAILGVSRSCQKPVFVDGGLQARLMLPMSLSYDHRVIDGALAVRFTTFLAETLGDVGRLTGGVS